MLKLPERFAFDVSPQSEISNQHSTFSIFSLSP